MLLSFSYVTRSITSLCSFRRSVLRHLKSLDAARVRGKRRDASLDFFFY